MTVAEMPTDRLLSRAEACRELDVVDETIRRWVGERKLKEIQLPAGKKFRCRYERSEIERIRQLKELNMPLPVVIGE